MAAVLKPACLTDTDRRCSGQTRYRRMHSERLLKRLDPLRASYLLQVHRMFWRIHIKAMVRQGKFGRELREAEQAIRKAMARVRVAERDRDNE